MDAFKKPSAFVFYLFLIVFIIIAYLYNNGVLSSLFPKTVRTATEKRNIIEMEFKEKEFKEDLTKKYDKYAVEISGFEEGKKWQGDYNIDDANFMEGKSGYSLLSKNKTSNVIYLNKNLDLSKYKLFKILIFSSKEEDSNNIQRLNLRFGNKNDSLYFEYAILNIKNGWNLIKMAKENFVFSKGETEKKEEAGTSSVAEDTLWQNIEKVSIELTARPNTRVELTFDRLWAEKDIDYQEDFRTPDFDLLSVKNYNNQTYINIWSFGGNLVTFKKVTGVKNFSYTVKIIPQINGRFGINARTDISSNYGYYLDFNGIGSGGWQLYKIGKPVEGVGSTIRLDNGEIANFLFEENKPIWLRIQTSGNNIAGLISTDGKNFTKLTERADPEIKSGSIGFHTGGASYLVESIEFKQ